MDDKVKRQKAGHQEIQWETIAKFEFFDHWYNPYSRYLDIDKVDLLLRKRDDETLEVKYIEVQVKYWKLYKCWLKWEQKFFDYTSWRFFNPNEFEWEKYKNLFVAYVLSRDEWYRWDIFIFTAEYFSKLIKSWIPSNTKSWLKYKMCIAHSKDDDKWYLWKKTNFNEIDDDNTINVTQFRRNFNIE